MHAQIALFILVTLVAGGTVPGRAVAQDTVADVRTWAGRTVQVAQVSLEIQYTVIPPAQQQAAGGPGGAPGLVMGIGGYGGGGSGGTSGGAPGDIFQSLRAAEQAGGQRPEPIHARRAAYNVTLYQGGVAQQLPLSRVASLTFRRQLVADSTLPPYVARNHYVYAAQAVLTDGTTVHGEYVNLGTTYLRGTNAGGVVEIPWQEIEVVRFTR